MDCTNSGCGAPYDNGYSSGLLSWPTDFKCNGGLSNYYERMCLFGLSRLTRTYVKYYGDITENIYGEVCEPRYEYICQ